MASDMTPRSVFRRLGGLGPVAWLRQAGRPIPTEEYVEDGEYVVRADLPGIDPARDVDLSVAPGHLEIKAVRRGDPRPHGHTDISYGLFRRVVRLPDEADCASLKTDYTDGVLRMAFDLPGEERPTRLRPRRRTDPD